MQKPKQAGHVHAFANRTLTTAAKINVWHHILALKVNYKKIYIHIAMGERELRKKEGEWMYRLGTLRPQGLNEDDGFYAQNRKTRAGARRT